MKKIVKCLIFGFFVQNCFGQNNSIEVSSKKNIPKSFLEIKSKEIPEVEKNSTISSKKVNYESIAIENKSISNEKPANIETSNQQSSKKMNSGVILNEIIIPKKE